MNVMWNCNQSPTVWALIFYFFVSTALHLTLNTLNNLGTVTCCGLSSKIWSSRKLWLVNHEYSNMCLHGWPTTPDVQQQLSCKFYLGWSFNKEPWPFGLSLQNFQFFIAKTIFTGQMFLLQSQTPRSFLSQQLLTAVIYPPLENTECTHFQQNWTPCHHLALSSLYMHAHSMVKQMALYTFSAGNCYLGDADE